MKQVCTFILLLQYIQFKMDCKQICIIFLFAKSFTERKSLKTIDLVTFVKQVFDGIYVNLLVTFKNSSFTTDFFMKDYCG